MSLNEAQIKNSSDVSNVPEEETERSSGQTSAFVSGESVLQSHSGLFESFGPGRVHSDHGVQVETRGCDLCPLTPVLMSLCDEMNEGDGKHSSPARLSFNVTDLKHTQRTAGSDVSACLF